MVAIQNRPLLIANIQSLNLVCPPGHFSTAGGGTASNGTCKSVSYPKLENDIFWQNSSYYIGVGGLAPGTQNQQNLVTLYNAFTAATPASQTVTGQCVAASYWDIGVRGDTGPTNHGSTFTLNPMSSVLTNTSGYPGAAFET